jgi:hypothetical protein
MGDFASGQKKPDVFIAVLSALSGFAGVIIPPVTKRHAIALAGNSCLRITFFLFHLDGESIA